MDGAEPGVLVHGVGAVVERGSGRCLGGGRGCLGEDFADGLLHSVGGDGHTRDGVNGLFLDDLRGPGIAMVVGEQVIRALGGDGRLGDRAVLDNRFDVDGAEPGVLVHGIGAVGQRADLRRGCGLGFGLGSGLGFGLGHDGHGAVGGGHDAVQRVEHCAGGDAGTGHLVDAVFAVGKRRVLADELAGERALGGQLAQTVGLVGRIDGQRGDGVVVVELDGEGHVAAEALDGGGDGLGRLLAAAVDDGVDGVDGRGGGERRAADRLNAVLAVGEGSGLADELAGEGVLRAQLAQAVGLVRGIYGQVFDAAVLGHADGHGHIAAEALLRGGDGLPGVGAGGFLGDAQLLGVDVARHGVDAADHRA